MSRLIRRLFPRLSETPRPARRVHRAADLRARLLLQPLESRAVPAAFLVTSPADAGPGSLRQAILDANAAAGADTITFGPAFATPQVVFLNAGQLTVSDAVTITGPGVNNLILNGSGITRVFNVSGTGTLAVTLTGMTITGGKIAPSNAGGDFPTAGDGAGVFMADENVTLDGVVVSGNVSAGGTNDGGGGIGVGSNGRLTVRNSTVSGNQTNGAGGGIYFLSDGALLVENSTISGNTAGTPVGGGGIYFYGTVLTTGALTGLTVRNSTISGNIATNGSGGGISLYPDGGTLLVQNSTITNNSAGNVDTAAGAGGGGIALSDGTGTINLQSTIVAGNTAANGRADIATVATGATVTADHSAIGNSTGFTLSAASAFNLPFGTALNLQPLANNGGSVQTILPGSGSAALDHGSNPAGLTTDERGAGFPRANFLPDIGAIEGVSPNLPIAILGPAANVTANGGTVYTFTVAYADAAAVRASTLDGNDIRVTGPNGFNLLAAFVSVTPATGDGSLLTATYSFTPPGGSWDAADYGTYAFAVEPNQVTNTTGAAVAAGNLGTFRALTPQTFTVSNTGDAGLGSLRDAIAQANARTGSPDVIVFDSTFAGAARTIALTSGELLVTDPVTVTGTGINNLTVRRAATATTNFRVFDVNGAGVIDVTLSGMTITGGNPTGTAGAGTEGDGGGIFMADENLTLLNVAVIGNTSATEGGGIGVDGRAGSLTLRNCTVSGNTATGTPPAGSSYGGSGGGIYISYGDNLLIENSTISGNTSTSGKGGGLYFYAYNAGSVTIRNSSVSGNAAATGGGGISCFDAGGSLLLEGSTVAGNFTAAGPGGGINIFVVDLNGVGGAGLTVRNSTVSGNIGGIGGGIYASALYASVLLEGSTISGNTALVGEGGGIYYYGYGGGGLTVRNSTISGNAAATSGGGIDLAYADALLVQNSTIAGNSANGTSGGQGGGGIAQPVDGTAPITVVSSIVSNNTNAAGPDIFSIATVNVNFSAVGNSTGFTPSAASGNNLPFGANLNLQPLADNGGPTRTIALGSGSAAINAGSNTANLTTDQRGTGFARVVGGAADIGAFESQTAAPTTPRVVGTSINGGAAQRSMVTSISVTFSTIVTLPTNIASAFTLMRIGGGAVTIGSATAQTVSGATVVTLSGFSGTEASFGGSLNDGRYTLTALASQITANGQQLDGNGDGTTGDNFVFADSGLATGNQLYRFFGDVNGDRFVNGADFALFRTAFGTQSPDPNYNAAFDVNGDGFVNGADFAPFRTNFGGSI